MPTANQGMFCCGQFTEDDCWYRARITKCDTKGDKVEVIYVDYGNHESLTLSRLRMLRRDEAELPMMAVLCALDDVTSLDGVRGDISFCEVMIIWGNEVLKRAVSGNCYFHYLSGRH